MADRVSSDNPSVTTIRAELARRGGTRRPEVRLPTDADVPADDVVRLVIDDREYHARIERRPDGTPAIGGAFDNARLARAPAEGTDRLAEWVADRGLDFGRSVLVDEVVPGFRYGLRVSGEETVYDASNPPSQSLRDIAEGLGDGA